MALTEQQLSNFIESKMEQKFGELIGPVIEQLDEKFERFGREVVEAIINGQMKTLFGGQVEEMWKTLVAQEYGRLFPKVVPVKKQLNTTKPMLSEWEREMEENKALEGEVN